MLVRFLLIKNDSDRSSEECCLYGVSLLHFHPPDHGRAKTWQGFLPVMAMAPPGEGSQAYQTCGREQERPIKKAKLDGLALLRLSCQATVNVEESCDSVYILSPQAGVGKPRLGGACR